jgi:hypothetical protein
MSALKESSTRRRPRGVETERAANRKRGRGQSVKQPAARSQLGSLLPIAAVTEDGLVILTDGTLLRAVKLNALAPLRMSNEEGEQASRSLGDLATLLPDKQALQLITHANPLDPEPIIADLRDGAITTNQALSADGEPERGAALERLSIITAEGLLEHAEQLSAMQLEHHLIIPWTPSRLFARGRVTADRLANDIEDHASHLHHLLSHLHALDLEPTPLTGSQILDSLYKQINPARQPPSDWDELLGGLHEDPDQAEAAAQGLRNALAQSAVDNSNPTHLLVDGIPVQTRVLSNVPTSTHVGWLMTLMQSPYPFTLSVRWEAGRRTAERQKAKSRYRQHWGVGRGREMRGKVPDPEAIQREQEAGQLTAELSTIAGAGIYQVSVHLSIRNPYGTVAELTRHTREIERELLANTDARLHMQPGAQLRAWQSTWPLGRDTLGIRRRYATTNVADTTPHVAARCGSPTGILLGWARPGRTLERLDPFDPVHDNHLLIVAARSGRGKTMAVNLILSQIIAQGAHGGVIDRAGHYQTLANLVPGSISVNLGTTPRSVAGRRVDPWDETLAAEDRPAAINPWDVADPRDVGPEKIDFLLALHSFFLGRRQEDGTHDLDPRDHSQLSLAIRDVYRLCAATQGTTGQMTPREQILQDVLQTRAETARGDGNFELANHLSSLCEGLHDYVGDGAGAYLADWPTSVPDDSPLVIFDTRHVGELRAGAVMFTIVEHLERRATRMQAQTAHRGPWGGRSYLVIDEGWKMLESRSSGKWINEQARRSRHNRLFMVAITQMLSDFLKNPEGAALVSQSSMQLFLGQYKEQAAVIGEALGLTDVETRTIEGLNTHKGQYAEAFLCNGRRGRGLIEIRAGRAQFWITTSEPDHDQPLRNHVVDQRKRERIEAERAAGQWGGDSGATTEDWWSAIDELTLEHVPLGAAT